MGKDSKMVTKAVRAILTLVLLTSTLSAQVQFCGVDSAQRTLVNLNLWSEGADNAAWTKTRTSVTANNIIAPDGTTTGDTYSATTTTNSFLLSQSVSGALIGQTRRQIAHLRAGTLSHAVVAAFETTGSVTRGVRINIGTCAVDSSQNITSSSATAIGDGWCRVIFEYLVANNTAIETYVNLWDGTASGYYPSFAATTASNIGVWGISSHLTSAPSTYIRTTDTQVTAGLANTTAQVTERNDILRSEEFDNATWTKTRSSITANIAAAPNGTFTADALVEDATASNDHRAQQAVSGIISGHAYSVDIYAKQDTRSWFGMYASFSPASAVTYYNASNCSVGTISANATASASTLDNGWCRFRLNVTSNATSGTLFIYMATGNNVVTYTGDGASRLFLWGAQIRPASSPTDYLPTTSAAATLSGVCPAGTTQSLNDPSRCFAVRDDRIRRW